MEQVDQIIHAKWLITGSEQKQTLEKHAIVIHQGMIHAILPSDDAIKTYSTQHEEYYPSHALMPGLINTHTHVAMNYFRGLADDLLLMDWLNHHIWPAEKKWVSAEFVHDASLFAIAEMIRSGTTCFNDMYFFLQSTAEAAKTAGIRAHIGITVMDFPTAWADTADAYFTQGIAFHEEYKNDPLITSTLAPHAPYTVCDKNLLRVLALAEQHDLKINLHLHESADEVTQSLATFNKRPIQRLHDIGFLSPRLIAIHMTQLDDTDLAILADTRPAIVHCPESNMKLACGACPVTTLQDMGLTVALGTDSAASNNDLNLLGEMRTAALLAKLTSKNPAAMAADQALNLATINGAKALGIDHLTGSLTPGKAADFIAIQLNELETQPLYQPISHIVYAAARHQVSDVWVAGKQLLRNRQLTTLDESHLLEKAAYWQERIQNQR